MLLVFQSSDPIDMKYKCMSSIFFDDPSSTPALRPISWSIFVQSPEGQTADCQAQTLAWLIYEVWCVCVYVCVLNTVWIYHLPEVEFWSKRVFDHLIILLRYFWLRNLGEIQTGTVQLGHGERSRCNPLGAEMPWNA